MLGVEPAKLLSTEDGRLDRGHSSRRWSIGGGDGSQISHSISIRWRSSKSDQQQTCEGGIKSAPASPPSKQGLSASPRRSMSLILPSEHEASDLSASFESPSSLSRSKVDKSEPAARARRRKVLRAVFGVAKTLSRFAARSPPSSVVEVNSSLPSNGNDGRRFSAGMAVTPFKENLCPGDSSDQFLAPGSKSANGSSMCLSDTVVECSENGTVPVTCTSSYDDEDEDFYSLPIELSHERLALTRRSISMEEMRGVHDVVIARVSRTVSCADIVESQDEFNSTRHTRASFTADVQHPRSGSLSPINPLVNVLKKPVGSRRQMSKRRKSLSTLMRKSPTRSRAPSRGGVDEDIDTSEVYLTMCAEFNRLLAPVRGSLVAGLAMTQLPEPTWSDVESDSHSRSASATRPDKPTKPKRCLVSRPASPDKTGLLIAVSSRQTSSTVISSSSSAQTVLPASEATEGSLSCPLRHQSDSSKPAKSLEDLSCHLPRHHSASSKPAKPKRISRGNVHSRDVSACSSQTSICSERAPSDDVFLTPSSPSVSLTMANVLFTSTLDSIDLSLAHVGAKVSPSTSNHPACAPTDQQQQQQQQQQQSLDHIAAPAPGVAAAASAPCISDSEILLQATAAELQQLCTNVSHSSSSADSSRNSSTDGQGELTISIGSASELMANTPLTRVASSTSGSEEASIYIPRPTSDSGSSQESRTLLFTQISADTIDAAYKPLQHWSSRIVPSFSEDILEVSAGEESECESPCDGLASSGQGQDNLVPENLHLAVARHASNDSLDMRNIKWRDEDDVVNHKKAPIRRSAGVHKQKKAHADTDNEAKGTGIMQQEILMRQWSTRRSKIRKNTATHRIIASYEKREIELLKNAEKPELVERKKALLSISVCSDN